MTIKTSHQLTAKQRRFVAEYLIDLNATQAAIRAGYSKKTAEQGAAQLLRNIKVAAAIAAGQAKQEQRAEVAADDVIRELAKIGFANMLDYVRVTEEGDAVVDLSKLTREQAAAIGEVTVEDFKDGRGDDARDVRRVKFKLSDKRAALVDLGRHFALFTDKAVVDLNHGVQEMDDAELDAHARRLAETLGIEMPAQLIRHPKTDDGKY